MTRDEFIESNLPLVHKLANRFRGRGVEYEELYAAGCVGLVKAADRFEPERGLCFSTYAVPVILGEIRRLFRDGGSVKISRSLKELSVKAARAREELCSRCGGEPRISDIARELGVSPEEAAEALCAGIPPVSLDHGGEDGEPLPVPSASGEDRLIDRLALRQCLDCGNIGCCDSSVGQHATAHFHETTHPVMESAEPGEDWRWCYVHHATA